MKSYKNIFTVVAAGFLLAGCASNDETIYFASAAKPPTFVADKSPVGMLLSKSDEHKIEMVVYSYLLERDLGQANDYSAFFIQADDSVVDALIMKFPKHTPPLKQSWHIDLRSNQSPLDRDTGRPVMILGADVSEPNADGSVSVVGRWYAGGAVKGFYTFTLKKTGEAWTIASVR